MPVPVSGTTKAYHTYRFCSLAHVHLPAIFDRLGSEPILSIKRSISIGAIINFDGDGHGHGNGNGICRQNFEVIIVLKVTDRFGLEPILSVN